MANKTSDKAVVNQAGTVRDISNDTVKISSMNIYQKMLAITSELGVVAKNLEVSIGKGGKYKATGEADVLHAVKPLEIKYGVYSYPFSRVPIREDNVVVTTTYTSKDGASTATDKNNIFFRIETIYRFVNVDDPKDHIDITTYGDGVDTQDKAPGKAMTYADKYALLKAYKIQTGDDPDQDGSGTIKTDTNYTAPTPTSMPTVNSGTIVPSNNDELSGVLASIRDMASTLQTSGTPRVNIVAVIKKHFLDSGKPSANYTKITDVNVAKKVLDDLKLLGKEGQ